jgi:hypothetical protein
MPQAAVNITEPKHNAVADPPMTLSTTAGQFPDLRFISALPPFAEERLAD